VGLDVLKAPFPFACGSDKRPDSSNKLKIFIPRRQSCPVQRYLSVLPQPQVPPLCVESVQEHNTPLISEFTCFPSFGDGCVASLHMWRRQRVGLLYTAKLALRLARPSKPCREGEDQQLPFDVESRFALRPSSCHHFRCVPCHLRNSTRPRQERKLFWTRRPHGQRQLFWTRRQNGQLGFWLG